MRTFESRNVVRLCVVATVLCVLLASALGVRAQGTVTVQVVQVDKSRFPEVDVYVSVTDAEGQPVKDLEVGDFHLVEDGRFAALSHVSRAGEQGPVTAMLLIDRSGSMDYADKMQAAREAAIAFVELMRPGDVTGVIAFNTQVSTVQPPTEDREALTEAIQAIEAVDDTALYDALDVALEMLQPVAGRKAIIAVTDGMNTAGQRTRDEILALAAEQGISIYTVGLGDPSLGTGAYAGIDEPTLEAIAEASNGIYTFAPNPEDLRGLYELLSLRIQNEYRLTYRSPNPLRDGTNRSALVTVATRSGPTEVAVDYNPGGVIPEVEPRSTWGLFGLSFAALAFLLVLPGAVSRLVRGRAAASGRAASRARPGGGRSTKGRVRLTDTSDPSRKRKP
jgi:VWFA-related protein